MKLSEEGNAWVLEKATCSAENALSPALVAKLLKLPYNVLYYWHRANLAIQKAFHLQELADSTRLCCQLPADTCSAKKWPEDRYRTKAEGLTFSSNTHGTPLLSLRACSRRRKTCLTRLVDWPPMPRLRPARLTSMQGKPAVKSSVSCADSEK